MARPRSTCKFADRAPPIPISFDHGARPGMVLPMIRHGDAWPISARLLGVDGRCWRPLELLRLLRINPSLDIDTPTAHYAGVRSREPYKCRESPDRILLHNLVRLRRASAFLTVGAALGTYSVTEDHAGETRASGGQCERLRSLVQPA